MHVKGRSHNKFKFPNLILAKVNHKGRGVFTAFFYAFNVIKKYYSRKVKFFSDFMTLKMLLKEKQKVGLHFVFTEASKDI